MKKFVFITLTLCLLIFSTLQTAFAQTQTTTNAWQYTGGTTPVAYYNFANARVRIGNSTVPPSNFQRFLVDGGIASWGSSAGLEFEDRTIANRLFTWYAHGNKTRLWTNDGNKELMTINSADRRVSLLTNEADTKLALYENASGGDLYGFGIRSFQFKIHLGNSNGRFSFLATPTSTDELLTIKGNGQVGIGTGNTIPTGFKLAIVGKAIAEEVQVDLKANWPDYVFTPNHSRLSLPELAQYIQTNKHLPNIPTAAEVQAKGGIELGDMSAKLLEKVEELTLYIIEQNQQIKQLQTELEQLKKSNRQ